MPKPKTSQKEKMFTIPEVAEIAGVDRNTVQGWVQKGHLRARKKGIGITSPILIYASSLTELLKKREIIPPAEK